MDLSTLYDEVTKQRDLGVYSGLIHSVSKEINAEAVELFYNPSGLELPEEALICTRCKDLFIIHYQGRTSNARRTFNSPEFQTDICKSEVLSCFSRAVKIVEPMTDIEPFIPNLPIDMSMSGFEYSDIEKSFFQMHNIFEKKFIEFLELGNTPHISLEELAEYV